VGFDLDVRAELVAHRLFQRVRDLVRARERQAAVHFQVERDRQPPADRVHGDVMDRERAVACDHHHAFEHGLIVERARLDVDGRLGLRKFRPHALSIRALIAATRSSVAYGSPRR